MGTNVASGNSGMTSEFVRKELKAVVGARTIHRMGGPNLSLNMDPVMGSSLLNNKSPSPMVPGGKPLNQADLEALGLSYELPQSNDLSNGRQWDSPRIGESPTQILAPTRNTMEEAQRPAEPQMSLLQQLLSE